LSIVSTSVYQSGDALTLSDFTLKSANLSANIEPFERLCSNRWGFHLKNHQKPVDLHTIDNFLKELFLVKILFLDFVNRCNGFLWSVRQWMGLPDYEKNAVKQGAVSSLFPRLTLHTPLVLMVTSMLVTYLFGYSSVNIVFAS
jgi:hypothetical protein